jgi:sulfate adenylyltransferase
MYSHTLTDRQLYDLEMIMNGGFYPLTGFLKEEDYKSVINNLRLSDGSIWPMPITLDVSLDDSQNIDIGDRIILTDQFKNKLAYLDVESKYLPDKKIEALKVFGTLDDTHPSVDYLFNISESCYVGGTVIKIQDPIHTTYTELRRDPTALKQYFKSNSINNVIGFQTRNPMHKSHYTITKLALEKVPGSHLLIHPVVGMTKSGDIDYHTRVKCYKHIITKYDNGDATLSLLPLSMRMGGPREALWHALIRKNYGCTHFIVGRDHAGPGKDKTGTNFYDPYAAQKLCMKYNQEIGINIITFSEIGYVQELDKYAEMDTIIDNNKYTILNISGTQLRQKLKNGDPIPEWFAFPDIVNILRKSRGMVILLTGFSGAGKSTIAYHLKDKLLEKNNKDITILDGDEIRTHLSKGLGFSREDRDINIKRVAYVASLVSKNGGIAIVSCIAPYEGTRKYMRDLCKQYGRFIEIHVSTPIEKCEERDVKGLYKSVREGKIKNFTGIDGPYEIPTNPEITIDTSKHSINETIGIIMSEI